MFKFLKKIMNIEVSNLNSDLNSVHRILNTEINLQEVGEARSKIPSIFHD